MSIEVFRWGGFRRPAAGGPAGRPPLAERRDGHAPNGQMAFAQPGPPLPVVNKLYISVALTLITRCVTEKNNEMLCVWLDVQIAPLFAEQPRDETSAIAIAQLLPHRTSVECLGR